jgi:transcriptional regulator with XRE-family HTH domain
MNGKQANSSRNLPFVERIEQLRKVRDWSWDQLAEHLGVSRTTLHYLRTGRHDVSGKLLRSLERAEQEAGIVPAETRPAASAKALIEALHSTLENAKVPVTEEDHDRGFVQLELDYLRGAPPSGFPPEIKLTRPAARRRAEILADVLTSETYDPVLLACLPKEHASEEFLNLLTPFTLTALTEAAMTLVFGNEWKQRLSRAK